MAEQIKMAREYLEKNRVEIQCPYCNQQISNCDVEYLFNLNQYRVEFTYAPLNRLIKLSSDEKLKGHWQARGVTDIQSTFDINPMRCICTLNDLERLSDELEEEGARLEEFVVDFNDSTKAMEIMIQEDNVRMIQTDEFVCPRCHNLLPPSIFRSKVVRVGLCGSQNSGKTVWICSLEKSVEDFIDNGNDNIDIFFSFPSNSSDGITARYREYIRKLKGHPGIAPEGTRLSMAPVFFDFQYRENNYLLIIYDVSGEIQEAAGRRDLALQHFSQMDGYILMLDPELLKNANQLLKKPVEDHVIDRDEQRRKAKAQCEFLTREEQKVVQNGEFVSKSIHELLKDLGSRQVQEVRQPIVERKNPLNILAIIAANVDVKKRGLQHMALAIDKGDILNIPEPMANLKKNTLQIQTIENKIMMATEYLKDREYGGEAVLEKRANRFYGSVSCHVLAALGCSVNKQPNEHYRELEGEFAPFGVLEPLIKIIETIQMKEAQ